MKKTSGEKSPDVKANLSSHNIKIKNHFAPPKGGAFFVLNNSFGAEACEARRPIPPPQRRNAPRPGGRRGAKNRAGTKDAPADREARRSGPGARLPALTPPPGQGPRRGKPGTGAAAKAGPEGSQQPGGRKERGRRRSRRNEPSTAGSRAQGSDPSDAAGGRRKHGAERSARASRKAAQPPKAGR